MPTYPSLRRDLVVSRQETAEGPIFVLKNPQLGRFVRIREAEYFIARQFDGVSSAEEIRTRAEEALQGKLTATTLDGFARRLQSFGLLEEGTPDGKPTSRKQRAARLRGNIFILRFKLFDPDRVLGSLAEKCSFVFTRSFAWASVGVILLAVAVMISGWAEMHHNIRGLYRLETIPLAWCTLLCIVVGHEFSHGLTCKRFGGSVHELGLLLIYLQPAMYCNVSDAWLFPEKSKRMLVTLAGAWFELLAWAIAVILWRIIEPGTVPSYLALVIATTLGIKSLFNLNPLIKLDGYYLLSDYLEVPNLRSKAFGYLARVTTGWWRPAREAVARLTARERKIYWLYGLSAAGYSAWLLGFLLLGLGSFLVKRYQSWGFLLFVAMLGLVFKVPLRNALRSLRSHFSSSQSLTRRMKRLARMTLVLGGAGLALYFIRTELRVSGEFTILPQRHAELRAEVEGILEQIAFEEGDNVQAGDLIACLSDRDYRAELNKVNAEIAEKQAQLKLLKIGPRSEEIELARMNVTKEEERLKFARSYLEMEEQLFKEKLSSRKDFELAQETSSVRQSKLEASKGNLKLLLAGTRPETVEATEAEINRLQWQQQYLEEQLKRMRIISPLSGVVTTHRLKDKLGATVKKGEVVAEVQALSTVLAEILIPEQQVADLRVGQRVVLKARAHLDASFHGKITAIAPAASKSGEGIVQRHFVVTTQLENSDLRLRGEMSGNAKIYCGERRLYEIVFRRLLRFIRVEFWSWW